MSRNLESDYFPAIYEVVRNHNTNQLTNRTFKNLFSDGFHLVQLTINLFSDGFQAL